MSCDLSTQDPLGSVRMNWTLSPGYHYIMVVPVEECLHILSTVEIEHISGIILLLTKWLQDRLYLLSCKTYSVPAAYLVNTRLLLKIIICPPGFLMCTLADFFPL